MPKTQFGNLELASHSKRNSNTINLIETEARNFGFYTPKIDENLSKYRVFNFSQGKNKSIFAPSNLIRT